MRYRVLGSIELVADTGGRHRVGSPNQRTVLAVLLAAGGEVVPVDSLIAAMWGDDPPASAVGTLRTYVSRLRTIIGPALATKPGGYTLDVAAGEVDADEFETLVDAARAAEPAAAVDLYAAALDLWEGPAFGDQFDVEPVRAEARRLEERRSAARQAYAAALLAAGRADDAVAVAEALITAEPLREGGWAVLIEALARAQRVAEALRAYRRATAALADAGLEPSGRLRAAERVALSDDGGAEPGDRHRPPVVPSSFVGRDDDTRAILALLEHARLVTLTGPGGVGKTRLALEIARDAAERCDYGACVVELAPVTDPAAVPDVVAAALGVAVEGRPSEQFLAPMGSLDVTIVLDNAEHLIDAVAASAAQILAGGSAARIIATSRERLAVDGEHVWEVTPLAGSGVDAPAARLFRDRASAVGAAPDDAAVLRVVNRLDGLPLAIEMAAARLDTTSAEELADDLDERLDALRSVRRNVATRHRSLTDVLSWSESLLDEHEAATLADLSVFAGAVSVADLEGVLDRPAVAGIVRTLAARSLVNVERSASPTRFRLLQTVRSFAAHRLAAIGDSEALARRHATWFADEVRTADAQLRTVDEAAANERIESIFAEVRAAYGWAIDHDVDLAADLAVHLHNFAHTRFIDEPLAWAEALLELLPAAHRQRPVLLASVASRALRRGDLAAARRLAEEAVERAGDQPTALPALDILTDCGLFDGRVAESAVSAEAMRRLAERVGDQLYCAIGRAGIGLSATYGRTEAVDTDSLMTELDGHRFPPSGRGWIAYARGERCQHDDPRRAADQFAAALEAARAVNNRYLEGAVIVSLCSLQARSDDPADALDAFAEAVRHWVRLTNTTQLLTTLRNLAALFRRIGAAEPLAELLGTVDHSGVPTYGLEAQMLAAAREWAQHELGATRFAAANDIGARRDATAAATAALRAIDAVRG